MFRSNPLSWFLVGLGMAIALSLLPACNSRATTSVPAGEIGAMVSGQLATRSGPERSFYLYTPSSYRPSQALPLVVAFHGGHGQGDRLAANTRFNDLAERDGFLVAYPNGVDHHWNDGRDTSGLPHVDDVGFVRDLITELSTVRTIDQRRIYAVGTSNGGFMVQRLACELSERFAAFASLNATMPQALVDHCHPTRPVSLLMINGTADPIVPYNGGTVQLGAGGKILSVLQTVNFWRSQDHCVGQAIQTSPPNPSGDGTRAVETDYNHCSRAAEVLLYTLEGAGHSWPGTDVHRPALVGPVSHAINATQVVWDFFRRHTLT